MHNRTNQKSKTLLVFSHQKKRCGIELHKGLKPKYFSDSLHKKHPLPHISCMPIEIQYGYHWLIPAMYICWDKVCAENYCDDGFMLEYGVAKRLCVRKG